MKPSILLFLLLSSQLVHSVSKVYTGFNYGAFWGVEANAKMADDFLDGFNLAKNLSTHTPFDSARIFSCVTMGTKDEPTGAFDAAIKAKTNLFLGFWITPSKRGESNDQQIKNELTALEKGFQKHGQALSDLVIGLSVGNEDVYRWENTVESGLAADGVARAIDNVKKAIAASSFAKYMQGKPIGHVDTAQHAVIDNADFIGMTAYPYWQNESIAVAKASFHGSLENVKQRAGNRSVWIAEMGWPFQGPRRSDAVASAENLQKYWTEVGCSVFGLYNTFWFELLTDSTADQPDWGLIDVPSRQPRIKDLKCSSQAVPPPPATTAQNTTTFRTLSTRIATSVQSSSSVRYLNSTSTASISRSIARTVSTEYVNTTIFVTGTPTSSKLASTSKTVGNITITITTTVHDKPSSSATNRALSLSNQPWCVTVADIDNNGKPVTIGAGPAGSDGKCSAPPTYSGVPYATTGASVKPTPVPLGTPWCVTMVSKAPVPTTAICATY